MKNLKNAALVASLLASALAMGAVPVAAHDASCYTNDLLLTGEPTPTERGAPIAGAMTDAARHTFLIKDAKADDVFDVSARIGSTPGGATFEAKKVLGYVSGSNNLDPNSCGSAISPVSGAITIPSDGDYEFTVVWSADPGDVVNYGITLHVV